MLISGNRVSQSDIPSYLCHSALLIKIIATIRKSGTLQAPLKFQIYPTHFAFVLISQANSSINLVYILYRSVGIYTQRSSLSNSATERLINTTSTGYRGSRPSWALIGAGCSSKMQVAQGQGPVRDCALVH